MIDLTYTDFKGNVIAVSSDSHFVPSKGDQISIYNQGSRKQDRYFVKGRVLTEKGAERSDGILETQHDYVIIIIEECE